MALLGVFAFGSKRFVSRGCALVLLHSGVAEGERLDPPTALAVTVSIVAHSSTDVLVARWLRAKPGATGATA